MAARLTPQSSCSSREICSDFGAPKIKSDTPSTVCPSISQEVMGPDASTEAKFGFTNREENRV